MFEKLSQLQKTLSDFSPEGTNNKISVLNELSKIKIAGKKEVLHYHNQLLFLLSYAESKNIYSLAENEKINCCCKGE